MSACLLFISFLILGNTETINLTKVPLVGGYKACRHVFLHITV